MVQLTQQTLIDLVGKRRGHFKHKSSRIAKLIEIWPQLESKMERFIVRGQNQTWQSRLSYGILLMMETGIRTGNEGSAEGWICQNQIVAKKDNPQKGIKVGDVIWHHPLYGQHVQTFGLTTLLNKHVRRWKTKLRIDFVGKKLVDQSLYTRHPVLCRYCPRGKSNELFLEIDYYSLKKFVKKYVGRQYTPKDIRMAKANLVFIEKFAKQANQFEQQTTKSARRKILSDVIEQTALVIGHLKGTCRSAYLSQPLVMYLHHYEP
jgi:DNA topoisomerase IB